MIGPRLEVAQRTDPGRDPNKQVNEDSSTHQPTRIGHLFVVCDGMGGHALGQEASQLAVRSIVEMVNGAPAGTPPGATLRAAIAHAGNLVFQMGGIGPNAGRPGSTCVAALVHAGGAEIAHVGDSRAFLVRRGQIWQLTRDHSVVQQLIDLGTMTPEQAAAHPEANKITRALGMKPDTDVELRDPALLYEVDDILVLATDGLCDLARPEEIAAAIARAPSLDAAADELVRVANARGGHDNITVQIARVREAARPIAAQQASPAPTLVEPFGARPEKTVVDASLARPPNGPAPTIPHAVVPAVHPAVSANVPAPLPTATPTPITHPAGPPIASFAATAPLVPTTPITASTTRTNPGVPARSGCLALAIGLAIMGLILVGVFAWWYLREPR